jgi:hypothetical protein
MNLTMIALVVALIGLAPIASLDRFGLPETIWLALWGIGLLGGAAAVKTFSPVAADARLLKKPDDFIIEAA